MIAFQLLQLNDHCVCKINFDPHSLTENVYCFKLASVLEKSNYLKHIWQMNIYVYSHWEAMALEFPARYNPDSANRLFK